MGKILRTSDLAVSPSGGHLTAGRMCGTEDNVIHLYTA